MGPRIGLTGGIGSGKSEVGKVFAELGAYLIDADVLAREAVAPGTPGLRQICQRWPRVCRADGTLDREALAGVVFTNPHERADLIAIVHPYVRELMIERRRGAKPDQVIVHEVPLLFEAGSYRDMDANILVVAPRERRIERVMKRTGWSHEQVVQRMAAQIHPEDASKLADYVIDNSGSLDDLREKTKELYEHLRTLPAATR
ncbi:MAG TPA: dephospho-CoA kinase [Candidatus Acidoferrales bacterium]|nr:dephospho-CoA kinase [Candidatus Acidoferrales bacterium]